MKRNAKKTGKMFSRRNLSIGLCVGLIITAGLGACVYAGLLPDNLIHFFSGTLEKQPATPPPPIKHSANHYLSVYQLQNSTQPEEVRSYAIDILAEGLRSPDGLAIDQNTGRIYVTEETASRICLFENQELTPLISRETPIFCAGQKARELNQPEGLALASDGTLFVAEDRPGGRLIRFTPAGKGFKNGEVMALPGNWDRFAWECVDISPDGEILLCGSDMEYATQQPELVPFTGIILYRDKTGQWWIPYERLFSSFSSVRFSKTGKQAIYTCEASGEIGWLDLTTRQSMGGNSALVAHSPEGCAILPNGMIVVAQESGSIVMVNPATDKTEIIADNLGSIESVEWDALEQRIVVTADGSGMLLTITPTPMITDDYDAMAYAPYHPAYTPKHIPQDCPDYLARVLAQGGLDYQTSKPNVSFRRFARRVPLIAADVIAEPILMSEQPEDPIARIQFVVFRPNRIGIDEESGQTVMPLAAFAAVTKSGRVIRTSRMKVKSFATTFEDAEFKPIDLEQIVVPQPAAVSVSTLGIATVQFLGMGQTEDYSLVLNPRHPSDSYMVVFRQDGKQEQYKLFSANAEKADTSWVIALAGKGPDEWMQLGSAGTASQPAVKQVSAVNQNHQPPQEEDEAVLPIEKTRS